MAANNDQVALGWVREEVTKTLNQARQALEAYVDSPEEQQMQLCVDGLHQVLGTLQILGLPGAVQLTEALETFAKALHSNQINKDEISFDALMGGILQLNLYLQKVYAGQSDKASLLNNTINQLRRIQNLELIPIEEESDLPTFKLPQPTISFELPESEDAFIQLTKKLRHHFQLGLLGVIKQQKIHESLQRIHKVLERLEAISYNYPVAYLWYIADGFVASLESNGNYKNKSAKILLGKVDKQLKRLSEAGKVALNDEIETSLIQELVSTIKLNGFSNPRITEILSVFDKPAENTSGTSEVAFTSAGDEAMDAAAEALKDDIDNVKDSLDLLMRGNADQNQELFRLEPQLKQISNTLILMNIAGPSESLKKQLALLEQRRIDNASVEDDLVMSFADSILQIEASISDLSASSQDLTIEDAQARTKEHEYLEAQYQFVKECRVNLQRAQDSIVDFMASSGDKSAIEQVPTWLGGAEGGFRLLDLPQLASMMLSCKGYVEQNMLQSDNLPAQQELDALADVLTGVEYYLEGYDESGSHSLDTILVAAQSSLQSLTQYAEAVPSSIEPEISIDSDVEDEVEIELADQVEIEEPVSYSQPELTSYSQSDDLIDDEIIEIFIEEAEDVLATLHQVFPLWKREFNDNEALTTTRRSFHTLKGSGRLVGAKDIGELAWAVENFLNKIIAGTLNPTTSMVNKIDEVIEQLPSFIDAFKSGNSLNTDEFIHYFNSLSTKAESSISQSDSVDTSSTEATTDTKAETETETVDSSIQTEEDIHNVTSEVSEEVVEPDEEDTVLELDEDSIDSHEDAISLTEYAEQSGTDYNETEDSLDFADEEVSSSTVDTDDQEEREEREATFEEILDESSEDLSEEFQEEEETLELEKVEKEPSFEHEINSEEDEHLELASPEIDDLEVSDSEEPEPIDATIPDAFDDVDTEASELTESLDFMHSDELELVDEEDRVDPLADSMIEDSSPSEEQIELAEQDQISLEDSVDDLSDSQLEETEEFTTEFDINDEEIEINIAAQESNEFSSEAVQEESESNNMETSEFISEEDAFSSEDVILDEITEGETTDSFTDIEPEEVSEAVSQASNEHRLDTSLLEIFVSETESHIDEINEFIDDALAADGHKIATDELVRALHTIKGSANMTGAAKISALFTPLETYFRQLNARTSFVEADALTLLGDATDFISEKLEQLPVFESEAGDEHYEELLQRINSIQNQLPSFEPDQADANTEEDDDIVNFLEFSQDLLDDALEDIDHWMSAPSDNDAQSLLVQKIGCISDHAEKLNFTPINTHTKALQTLLAAVALNPHYVNDDCFNLLVEGLNSITDSLDRIAANQRPKVDNNLLTSLHSFIESTGYFTAVSDTVEETIPKEIAHEVVDEVVDEVVELVEGTFAPVREEEQVDEEFNEEEEKEEALELTDEDSIAEDSFDTEETIELVDDLNAHELSTEVEEDQSLDEFNTEDDLELVDDLNAKELDTELEHEQPSDEFNTEEVIELADEAFIDETLVEDELVEDAVVEDAVVEETFVEDTLVEGELVEAELVEAESFDAADSEIIDEQSSEEEDLELVDDLNAEELNTELEHEQPSDEFNTEEVLELADEEISEDETLSLSDDAAILQMDFDEEPAFTSDEQAEDDSAQLEGEALDSEQQVELSEEDEEAAEIMESFLEEADDILLEAVDVVDAWSLDPHQSESPASLLRLLHTLKGAARLANASVVGNLSHQLEDLIEKHQADEIIPLVEKTFTVLDQLVQCHHAKKELPSIDAILEEINLVETLDKSSLDEEEILETEELSSSEDLADVIEAPAPSTEISTTELTEEIIKLELEDEDFEILEIYIEEASELLNEQQDTLQLWGEDLSNKTHVQLLQRQLHTLKGGARLSGITILADISHELESLFEKVVNGRSEADETLLELAEQGRELMVSMLDDIVNKSQVSTANQFIRSLHLYAHGGELPGKQAETSTHEQGKENSTDGALTTATQSTTSNVIKLPQPVKETKADQKAANAARTSAPQVREMIRVGADTLETLVNLAGETSIFRARLEQQVNNFRFNLDEISGTVARLRAQVRNLEIETEAQIEYRREQFSAFDEDEEFDPLEMDRYTRQQELTKGLGETSGDLLNLKDTLDSLAADAELLLLQQSRVDSELSERLMKTRLIPFSSIVPRLRRMVKQIGDELDKPIQLTIQADGEMDRTVLERLIAPIEHMLRNAIDHGIEDVAKRLQANKSDKGRISIKLYREGAEVVVEISDDGQGINLNAVRKKAIERGLITADATLSDHELQLMILEAGFSTAEKVTQISGRGVGMDVVNSEIKNMGGLIDINAEVGKGSTFTIRLPFTVSVNQALMVKNGDEIYAIPLTNIEGIVRVSPFELEEYYKADSPEFIYADEPYQLRYMGKLLDHDKNPDLESLTKPAPLLLLHGVDHPVAMQVDELLGSREVVVKSVGTQLSMISGISGATILGDGNIVLILDLPALLRRADAPITIAQEERTKLQEAEEHKQPVVMVVDDSITVRKVTTRLLQRNNFDVMTAKDGVDAVNVLHDRLPDVMLLDIEMPRMDGFELATLIRHDDRLKNIPIIMITSRTGDKHKARAKAIGVNEYMGKPFNEVDLLKAIEDLIGR